ncbi:hypothetical protein OIU85_010152 [Salix viminalis]|uniref:Uncharacterized protein n=1 Tax=Salix viminalis TaxID=40686 RepID=A0A9Q0NW12_SALVM|nr:hypothetical protein OIU85_010152 [Salix viminalis]
MAATSSLEMTSFFLWMVTAFPSSTYGFSLLVVALHHNSNKPMVWKGQQFHGADLIARLDLESWGRYDLHDSRIQAPLRPSLQRYCIVMTHDITLRYEIYPFRASRDVIHGCSKRDGFNICQDFSHCVTPVSQLLGLS